MSAGLGHTSEVYCTVPCDLSKEKRLVIVTRTSLPVTFLGKNDLLW